MGNFIALKDFAHHLRNFFLKYPEKLPIGINVEDIQVRPFQNAWVDKRLGEDHQYVRYMDVLFAGNESTVENHLHSFIVTYSCKENIVDVTKMEFYNKLTSA